MNIDVRAALGRAGNLVEAGWIQSSMAENGDECVVPFMSGEAESFCAIGAVLRAAMEMRGPHVTSGLEDLRVKTVAAAHLALAASGAVERDGPETALSMEVDLVAWNDDEERTRDEVVSMFREAGKHAAQADWSGVVSNWETDQTRYDSAWDVETLWEPGSDE